MNYMKIDKASVNDGVGVRVVLYVSGCDVHCEECHNPETHDINAGYVFDESAKEELFEALSKNYIRGLTISGGHPLHPKNLKYVRELMSETKSRYPEKDIWLYTGYTWEQIHLKSIDFMLKDVDILVDGPFIKELKDLNLPFRGSRNQRLIDVQASLVQNKIVELKIVGN